MKKILVIGTGGLAREFISFFSHQVEIVGFSSTNKNEFIEFNLPGIFFEGGITPSTVGTDMCVIAIGSPATKRKISENLKSKGFTFPNLIHTSSVAEIEFCGGTEGVIISPNCTLGSNIKFESHVYVNFMVGVGHDSDFHSYIQVNPGVQIGGFSTIESEVIIGSGATIRQGLKVGQGATVGSGSVVLTSVRTGITVIGNPARRLKLPSFE